MFSVFNFSLLIFDCVPIFDRKTSSGFVFNLSSNIVHTALHHKTSINARLKLLLNMQYWLSNSKTVYTNTPSEHLGVAASLNTASSN